MYGQIIKIARCLLAVLLLVGALARAETNDPFDTQRLISPSVGGQYTPCALPAPGKTPLALADVVERVLCHNPQTRSVWANARFQAAQLGVSQSAYFPTVNLNGGFALNNVDTGAENGSQTYSQKSTAVTLGYTLYDFGARDANQAAAVQVLSAANASHEAAIQSVFLAAVQGYYQVYASIAVVESAEVAERSSLQSFNAAEARYRSGMGTPADKLQAHTAYAQAQLNKVRAEGNLRIAKGVLANLMGMDATVSIELETPVMVVPPSQYEDQVARLVEVARQQRPDLAAADAQIKAAQAGVDLAQSTFKPSVSLSGSLGASENRISHFSRNAAVGVQVTIPVFNGYLSDYRVRAAEAQVAQRQAQRDGLALQVALDVWRAYQGLVTETQAVRASQDLMVSATQSEAVALGRYQAGVGNILDVLTAQSALANARQQTIQSSYNWQIARATLAQAMGQIDITVMSNQP